ncbi:MAG: T9SS type A sorting domain-containing protein, partial [Bacteroidia bacterium]|nr:T9SS type A sorting domain-containing protein [Bacteroidia bacterium]
RITAPVAGSAKITVVNTISQVVSEKQATIYAGTNNLQLDVKDLLTGVYSVMIESNNGTIVKKLTINK